MVNIYIMMVNILLVKQKIMYQMVKELNIIKMETYSIKVILLMVNLKEMEKLFMKMVNIILDDLKMD